MAKFKVGDKVIVARRGRNFASGGEMDKYIGKEFFVNTYDDNDIFLSDSEGKILSWEINQVLNPWYFGEDCLELAGPYTRHHMMAKEICGEFNHGEV